MAELFKAGGVSESTQDIWFSTLPFYKNPSRSMVGSVLVSIFIVIKVKFQKSYFTHSFAISYSILTLLINRNSLTFQALSYDILHFLVYHLSSILFAWPPMNVKSYLRFKR